jgi:prenyltransferase beta subunit
MYSQNVGVTALCGLAFLASGSTPDRGPYGRQLTAITNYLLACRAPNGYIVESNTKSHGPMYGHGFAVMYLAEVYGMTDRPDLRLAVKQGVQLILDTQNEQGGWRYFPTPKEADISVTVCEMMALRAARNAGIAVPKETIDKAVNYIRLCQVPEDGGFRYRALEAAESRFPRSAAAIVALYTAGIHDDPLIQRGQLYLRRHLPGSPLRQRDPDYYFYGEYYGVQAAWHIGGDLWTAWYPAIAEELLSTQSPQGFWRDNAIGHEYATAMALIVLIFQR